MLRKAYKFKRLEDGFWYVLASDAHQAWAKVSETRYRTAKEAEQAICWRLDADAARHEGPISVLRDQSE